LDQKKQLLQTQQLQALAYQSEIRALKSQIEPHFLFNTLNSISASIPPSMEQTRVMIAQLADTFRHALHTSNRAYIALEEELEFIKTLLALEQQRFKQRLQVEYQIDRVCLNAALPPMLLQPLIENALNHGISPKVGGGTVHINCRKEGTYVHIAVSDTGVGYKGALPDMLRQGVGLSNISKRLKLLYNESLQVQRNEQGLCFYFKIPFRLAHEEESIAD
jgi:LytS/YehU family sensor histidine kinase